MPKCACRWVLYTLLVLFLVGCGGHTNPDGTAISPGGGTGDTTTPDGGADNTPDDGAGPDVGNGGSAMDVAQVHLIAESPDLPSAATLVGESGNRVKLFAVVTDRNSQVIAQPEVTFSAPLAADVVVQSSDVATEALLYNGGNPTERAVTVTAKSGGHSDAITIHVTGNNLSLSGPSVISAGQDATYSATLTDSANQGIAEQPVEIVSAQGNTITPLSGTLTTNGAGLVEFAVTGEVAGQDVLTVNALDGTERAILAVSVDAAAFALVAPDENARVRIGDDVPITVVWKDQNGQPVVGAPITFRSTRGMFTTGIQLTDNAGEATAKLSSAQAGPATVIAATAAPANLTASSRIQFIAVDPAALGLKADPEKITPQANSSITATVRDGAGNPVTGVDVFFSVDGTTGGTLAPAVAQTDTAGQASSVFTAGTASNESVLVKAEVDGVPAAQVEITIAGEALFITLGTGGNLGVSPEPQTLYSLPFTVYVTDAAGNPVQPAPTVALQVESIAYQEGKKLQADTNGDGKADVWSPVSLAPADAAGFGCAPEDIDADGEVDPGEDVNGNGVLDPGQPATVPSFVALEENGLGTFQVTYGKQYSGWVKVRLTATGVVSGSENVATAEFVLPMDAEDHKLDGTTPPGKRSPFGTDGNCSTSQ